MKKSLVLLTGALLFSLLASAQNTLPLVFGKEDTGKAIKKISISPAQLSYNNEALPDPFLYQDGTYNADYKGWERHRNETARMVQDYEIGPIPSFKKSNRHLQRRRNHHQHQGRRQRHKFGIFVKDNHPRRQRTFPRDYRNEYALGQHPSRICKGLYTYPL